MWLAFNKGLKVRRKLEFPSWLLGFMCVFEPFFCYLVWSGGEKTRILSKDWKSCWCFLTQFKFTLFQCQQVCHVKIQVLKLKGFIEVIVLNFISWCNWIINNSFATTIHKIQIFSALLVETLRMWIFMFVITNQGVVRPR